MEKKEKKGIEGTILVVEDDPAGCDLLVRFLQMIGCQQVVTRSSGEEALNYLRSHTAKLVLLDYRLPGISGLHTLRQIKQLHPGLPVIMTTAFPTREAMLIAIQEGACDLMVKPLDLWQLEKQVLRRVTA